MELQFFSIAKTQKSKIWHNFHNLYFCTQSLDSIFYYFRFPYHIRLWLSFFALWCQFHITVLSKHYTQFSGLHTLLTENLKASIYNTQVFKSLNFQVWWAIWQCELPPGCSSAWGVPGPPMFFCSIPSTLFSFPQSYWGDPFSLELEGIWTELTETSPTAPGHEGGMVMWVLRPVRASCATQGVSSSAAWTLDRENTACDQAHWPDRNQKHDAWILYLGINTVFMQYSIANTKK